MDRPSVCARAPRSPRRPTAKAPCAMTAAKFAQWLLHPRNILIYSHMRNASFMEPAILFHHAIHCPPADVNAVLLKRKADAIHAVVSVIRMLFENLFDLSRKKLTAAVPAPVSKPPVITGLAQVQNTAHVRDEGWYHHSWCALRAAETPGPRLLKRLTCRFLRSGSLY